MMMSVRTIMEDALIFVITQLEATIAHAQMNTDIS